MSSVIYALSADPITNGHINIIDRALKTFDHVIVAIGINPKKKYTFTLEERENLTRKVLAPYGDSITVKSYSGLLSDFAYENQVFNIVRGARNAADFDFEKLLSDINHGLNMGLETFIMIADKTLSHISSSAVKELQEHQANNVRDYVPLAIKEALELRVSGQYRVGVTGGIGNGKTYVVNKLLDTYQNMQNNIIDQFRHKDIMFHSIDMDVLGRYILRESKEPIHIAVRKTIAEKIGDNLLTGDIIDIKSLLRLLFDDTEASSIRSTFEKIMVEPTMHLVRKNLIDKKGIVLISSALFVEQGICDLVNNNFIFVTCPDDVRRERLKRRGYSDSEIFNRLNAQLSAESKLESIRELVREQSCGNVLEFNNVDNSDILSLYIDLKILLKDKL